MPALPGIYLMTHAEKNPFIQVYWPTVSEQVAGELMKWLEAQLFLTSENKEAL